MHGYGVILLLHVDVMVRFMPNQAVMKVYKDEFKEQRREAIQELLNIKYVLHNT